MPLTSDIVVSAAKFSPAAVSEKAMMLNEQLKAMQANEPLWWEIGVDAFRKNHLPPPVVLPGGNNFTIPSREPGRSIPCRLFYPSGHEAGAKVKGLVLHFHGGGFVLFNEDSFDPILQFYADAGTCAVVSVGYRLAPEHKFPAGPEDCFDAADYFVEHAEKEYGAPLTFLAGESAGAHYAAVSAFHLLRTKPSSSLLGGLILHFGAYNLTILPQAVNLGKHEPPNLTFDAMIHFRDVWLEDVSATMDLKDPSISPMFEDLEDFRKEDKVGSRLPKALFTCGTNDCLLDDSVMMGTKWQMAGGQAIVKIYPGAPHGFIAFPELLDEAAQCLKDTKTFMEDCLSVV